MIRYIVEYTLYRLKLKKKFKTIDIDEAIELLPLLVVLGATLGGVSQLFPEVKVPWYKRLRLWAVSRWRYTRLVVVGY